MKLHHRTPDIGELYKVLRREIPARSTLFELFLNDPLYEVLAGRKNPGADHMLEYLRFRVDAFAAAGYDYVSYYASAISFPAGQHERASTISLNEGAVIEDERSFEAYQWPDPESFDSSHLERITGELPGNMKLMVMGPGGVLENVISLTGYDNLCYMLYEQPDLAQAIFDGVGSVLVRYYQLAAQHDSVGFIMSNDDWGFNTQTFLSPEMMRKYVFPWHRRIVDAGHAQGKLVVLHSCGALTGVMQDIVDMGYDAKHSYEDGIMPVEAFYEQWQGKIAILGGIDMDFMVRRTPDEILHRSRAMLERTAARGGYALGTGNSVPEYIPLQNYFAMISAALEP